MSKITIDTKSFNAGVKRLMSAVEVATLRGINDVASEVLRLGEREVPHDIGDLQTSGHVEPSNNTQVIVGYNRVYAARLHEHPEYRFQKGRKGKYLEDPIKNNLSVFKEYIGNAIRGAIN